MIEYESARHRLGVAAQCLRAAYEGHDESDDAEDLDRVEVGWLLVAEFMHLIRWTLSKQ